VLLKTLAKDKEDRYQNIAEMVRAMESLIGHTKSASTILSIPEEHQKPVAQKPYESTVDTMATVIQDEPSRDTLATVDVENQDGEALSAQFSQEAALQQTMKQETKSPVGWIVIGIFALVIGLIVGIVGWQQAQNIRAIATSEAYSARATATEQARQIQSTATAQARAFVAQATAVSLQNRLTKVFGPASGTIAHDPTDNSIATASSDVMLKNFITEAKIYNPYSIEEAPWTFAIDFRQTSPADNAIYLYISSNGIWSLDVDSGGGWDKISSGFIPNIDTSKNGSNLIRLIVYDKIATFYINNVFVDTIDISGNMHSGNVMLVASTEIAGKTTRFTGFTVWKLP